MIADLARACHAAGFELFDVSTSFNAGTNARRNLAGRSHYVDPDTLRFFNARILKCCALDSGLILGILESLPADPEHSRRVFRPVFFDLDGNTLARPGIDESHSTRRAAEREFWRIADSIDADATTRAMLDHLATRRERESAAYRAILAGGTV